MWGSWWWDRWPAERPDRWDSPAEAVSESRPEPDKSLVAQAGAWGFSPELARRVVTGKSWKLLTRGWRDSTDALDAARAPHRRLALVMLRAAILDEMESQDPEGFRLWLSRQQSRRLRRSR
jgi:hypothetical protein